MRPHPDAVQHARLDLATDALDPPLVVVDLDAFDANAQDMERRAGGWCVHSVPCASARGPPPRDGASVPATPASVPATLRACPRWWRS